MPSIGRIYRTLRHLKVVQVFHQVFFRLRTRAFWQKPREFSPGPAPECEWPKDLEFSRPSGSGGCLDLASSRFLFIGLEKDFSGAINWSGAGLGKLWDYNLHYFEWLWGLESSVAKGIVDDWIKRHPFASDAVGWEAYPLSLRIQNWLAYWGTVGREVLEREVDFRDRLWASVASQCDWLSRRLEKHLLGNHYLENGAALWLAGSFFDGAEAGVWKKLGRAILEDQLPEQVLADGMHFERSPMYHNRVVHLLSWLEAIDGKAFGSWLKKTALAASSLHHPDGRIALFNDSAFGIYPEPEMPEPNPGVFSLPDAGYYGARHKNGDYLLVDAGRIGPDYIPGHAHCDVLSFELSIGGRRFITDSGVFNYEKNERRHYCRSTAAHNTFGPVGYEQAEIWASFRIGRRPGVSVLEWILDSSGGFTLSASHDGFRRGYPMTARHERRFVFSPGRSLVVDEIFSADGATTWEGRIHFGPEVALDYIHENRVSLRCGESIIMIVVDEVDGLSLSESPYFPKFNFEQRRLCLTYRVRAESGKARVSFRW